jgi:hypothetical protein
VLGTAKSMISAYDWDVLNTQLGPTKKINLILVGFPAGTPSDMAQWQQAKWIGGKKNDLVICFAGGSLISKADWVNVFGWTEKDIVKHDIESLFLNNPINKDLIPKIAGEVNANYVKKDWHKFDYITIEPPTWSYWVYIIVMILVEGGLYFWFHYNEFDNIYYDERIHLNAREEGVIDKIKKRIRAIMAFFIKQPIQPAIAQTGGFEWPPNRQRYAPFIEDPRAPIQSRLPRPIQQFEQPRPIKRSVRGKRLRSYKSNL